tara:strand:+ start:613 stop:732 length:120 start_codon:yes stop_codon:yes gene_type:complete
VKKANGKLIGANDTGRGLSEILLTKTGIYSKVNAGFSFT